MTSKIWLRPLFLFLIIAEVIFVPGLKSSGIKTTSALFAIAPPRVFIVEKEVMATAYSPPLFPYKSPTRSGMPVGFGVVAVDPKVIPLGSAVFLPKMFPGQKFLALDTGAQIKGNHIDIWLPSRKQARQWGRRKVFIRVAKQVAK